MKDNIEKILRDYDPSLRFARFIYRRNYLTLEDIFLWSKKCKKDFIEAYNLYDILLTSVYIIRMTNKEDSYYDNCYVKGQRFINLLKKMLEV